MVTTMTLLFQKIWDMKELPDTWAYSLIIPIPQKGTSRSRDPKKCNNYRTIILISHPIKIMLRIILNRLNPIAENILAEEQAGLRKKRNTTEDLRNISEYIDILNCSTMAEKYIEHIRKLYHNFVDFKKAFDRVWHIGLWKVMRHFNIDEILLH